MTLERVQWWEILPLKRQGGEGAVAGKRHHTQRGDGLGIRCEAT